MIDIRDHLNGFDINLKNSVLDSVVIDSEVMTEYIFDSTVKNNYKNLKFQFNARFREKVFSAFQIYNAHPKVNFKNFLCSFNGAPHISRQLLTAILYKFGYFATDYCSKNFTYTQAELDGHIMNYCGDDNRFYRKFFLSDNCDTFYKTIHSFGLNQYDHASNIYTLEDKLTNSFLHLVSETVATSYYPYVTEKFMYSVVTRGLFLSYAQPKWHDHLEKYYGFKTYKKLFDYKFDSISNPIERLVELMTMISKFSKLSFDELYDMYLIELDTINYNYDHFFSGDYIKYLKEYEY